MIGSLTTGMHIIADRTLPYVQKMCPVQAYSTVPHSLPRPLFLSVRLFPQSCLYHRAAPCPLSSPATISDVSIDIGYSSQNPEIPNALCNAAQH